MKLLVPMFLLVLSTIQLFSQEEEFARVGVGEPFYVEEENDVEPVDQSTAEIPSNFRHYKKLSDFYNGYMVELLVADFPVGRNHKLLSRFGKVYYDINEESGDHHYFLLIPFEEDAMSLKFFESVIKPHAPESRLVFRKVKKKKRCKSCFNKF